MSVETGGAEGEPGFRLGHRRWLDGLRGVAILTVVAYHFGLLPGGFLGVDLFFVLSGFLITTLLLEEHAARGTIRLSRFYLRRALRLLPALLLTITALLVWSAACRPEAFKSLKREAVVVLCFGANMQDRLHRVPMGHLGFTWSLAVEEQFYLVWPLALLVLLRFGAPRPVVIGLIGVGIAVPTVLRLWLYTHLPPPTDPGYGAALFRLYIGPDTRGDAILYGCLVAVLAHGGYLPRTADGCRRARTAGVFALGLIGGWLTGTMIENPSTCCGVFTGFGLATAAVLVCMLSAPLAPLQRVLESAPLVAAGRISYGLFLFHMPLATMLGFTGRVGWMWPIHTLTLFAVSVLAAAASFYLIERPVLRLKDRFAARVPSATPSAVPAEPPARAAA